MTAKDHLPASPPALGPTERLPALGGLPPWGRQVLLLSAGGLLVDGVLHGLQGGGAWLGLGALAGGWIWMAKGQLSRSLPLRPKTVESWNERCQALLSQFDQLDPNPQQADGRAAALADLLKQKARQELRVALVSSIPPEPTHLPAFQAALRGPWPLRLLVSEPLPSSSSRWRWSDTFASCDALIFHLRPPLIAADLRWLDALPVNLPLWLLVEVGAHPAPETCLMDIQSQWPGMNPSRLLVWSGEPDLEAIKADGPLLVAKAAEAERLQWGAFLQEALSWLRQQNQGGPI
ncbi:MAG: hypothetical protein ACK575_06420, partial [Cyanobacteriota bacterium]